MGLFAVPNKYQLMFIVGTVALMAAVGVQFTQTALLVALVAMKLED